jgi:hypothetical protein
VLIEHRGCEQVELETADRDMGIDDAGELVQQLALMLWIPMEHVHAGADDAAGIELRQYLLQLVLAFT